MSLDPCTFSGSKKLPVSRSQTSASFSSCSRFQLIAETRSISFILSLTRTPLHTPYLAAGLFAALRLQTLPLGGDKPVQHKRWCLRVADKTPSDAASTGPGPGVTGIPGWNGAEAALKHLNA